MESLVAEWKLTKRTGALRAKPYEEVAPPFEHFNPRTASRRLDLEGFSTFAILAQSTEVKLSKTSLFIDVCFRQETVQNLPLLEMLCKQPPLHKSFKIEMQFGAD